MDRTRREVLKGAGVAVASGFAVSTSSEKAAAEEERTVPSDVTVSYDEDLIREYQPEFVLTGVDPRPSAFHALHAEKEGRSLNAVYGFTLYPYQEGRTKHDSHLGDHEPFITWYDASTGETERVDYAAYHWYRKRGRGSELEYATDARKRPLFRVDPDYHHYYRARAADVPAELIETENLLESLDGWLANGFDENLALSQPYDPWAMFSRESWRRESARSPIERVFRSVWFNLGLGAAGTSDLGGLDAW